MILYVTSDKIGAETGAGAVTYNEVKVLSSFDEVEVINIRGLSPFETDEASLKEYKDKNKKYRYAHFYAGTFSKLIEALKEDGTSVSYTCAAHDIEKSKLAHQDMNVPFTYPHLVDPELFSKYLQGYKLADLVIVPSTYSKETCVGYGCKNITVIPHGHYPPQDIKPLPKNFSVGYLGQPGPDKGLIRLIEAWNLLGYNDAQLRIAGKETEGLWPWIRNVRRGSVYLAGYVKSASDLYNACSVYVQPSYTEGFGIEVLEAMSHGRPVICSKGAGASDFVETINGTVIESRNSQALAEAIDFYKKYPDRIWEHGQFAKDKVKNFTWEKVRKMYSEVFCEFRSL
jgi:glycosyltransferase involved in cell wall biosynthesis